MKLAALLSGLAIGLTVAATPAQAVTHVTLPFDPNTAWFDLPVTRSTDVVEKTVRYTFGDLERFLEQAVVDPEHHVRIHLDEAAIAVPGEAGIARVVPECLDGVVVQAEIENGIHHAGHGGARTGADGEEKRMAGVAKGAAGGRLDALDTLENLGLQIVWKGLAALVVDAA
eukprot:gene58390-77908_t